MEDYRLLILSYDGDMNLLLFIMFIA